MAGMTDRGCGKAQPQRVQIEGSIRTAWNRRCGWALPQPRSFIVLTLPNTAEAWWFLLLVRAADKSGANFRKRAGAVAADSPARGNHHANCNSLVPNMAR